LENNAQLLKVRVGLVRTNDVKIIFKMSFRRLILKWGIRLGATGSARGCVIT
jgi:hypothetical protein